MNVYDSHRMASMLIDMGLKETQNQNDADVVIFNTCHIREKAAEKVFSDLGRAYLIKINDMTKRATILAPIYNIFRYFSIKFPLLLLFLLNIDFCAVI